MLRRPPTSIELKLDDINEYEEIKQNKEKNKKSFCDQPVWAPAGAKSKQEMYNRVGYVPAEQLQVRTNLL